MDSENIEICVKFPRYSNKLRFVTVNINNVNKNEFVKKALEIFRVPNTSTDIQVRLIDNRNASIPEEKLTKILKQFHRSGSFFVQIDYVQEPEEDFVPKIITPEMIRIYIEQNGGALVFEHLDRMRDDMENTAMNQLPVDNDENETEQNILPVGLRMTFVNCLADYTVSLFGLSPSELQLKNIADSAVALVPTLMSKSSDNKSDLLVNKLNGGSGFLYNRLRYLRRKDRDQCKKKPQTVNGPEELESTEENENQNVSDSNPSEFDSNDDHVTQQSYQMDDLLFLKTIVVNEDNLPEIRKMLRKTLSRRQELLNSEKVNLLEHFPFFFVHPQLTINDALPNLSKIKNEYPFIVACGEKEDCISHYIIAIDNQPMYVPKEFSFEETLDLFFKLHYVLSLEFEPRMENVFLFMEHYIYKIEGGEKRPYTTMIELSNLIID